ncbi:MurR/RpiR family transcriptional regulator [Streptomyces sp. TLI_105]|uniref:MurR/RpiR family transcriptional regulator n=1 Tax=Streptomyces sp. TLI_105 TaxID=1881019 RepID=UPI000897F9C9|nr:MurR/RpiR family transcriptional regulator [Streptomyces sp. TLI_105]SEE09289.1 transcriptional regulator, RpiR family [Streptomyces sp. TLI_105]
MASGALADVIRHKLGDLSPAERKVARVLLVNYPSAGFETVAVLAERAGVSAPTVIRFVNRLGYRGFPDFQTALREELDERNASPLSLYESADRTRTDAAPDGEASLLEQGSRLFSSAVAQTLTELPPHDLEHAVSLLVDGKRRITLTGGRFTRLLAQYLGLHLMQLRGDIRILPAGDVERTAALGTLTRRDVLVVFDYRRYEQDKVTMAQLAVEQGAKVILFTDRWLSPVSAHAEVVLPSLVTTPSPYDSFVPTLAVVETVVAGVVTALGDEAPARLRHTEEIARRLGLQ